MAKPISRRHALKSICNQGSFAIWPQIQNVAKKLQNMKVLFG